MNIQTDKENLREGCVKSLTPESVYFWHKSSRALISERWVCGWDTGGYSITKKILPLYQVFEPLKISDENAKIIGPLSISNIVQDSSIYLTVPKNAKHSIKVLIKSAQSGV